jgi:hypothetical protein
MYLKPPLRDFQANKTSAIVRNRIFFFGNVFLPVVIFIRSHERIPRKLTYSSCASINTILATDNGSFQRLLGTFLCMQFILGKIDMRFYRRIPLCRVLSNSSFILEEDKEF